MNRFKFILKILLFSLLLLIAIFYPKNLFDSLSSDIIVAISKKTFLSSVAKYVSLIFHDKILLIIMGVLGLFLFYIKEYKKSVFILSTAFMGGFLGLLIKNLVKRQRPLYELYDGYSFPSGHSLVVTIFFLSLIFIINKKKILETLSSICLFIVPVSRIMLGAHYITDVLAGVLLGIIIVDLLKIYYLKIYCIVMKIVRYNIEKK